MLEVVDRIDQALHGWFAPVLILGGTYSAVILLVAVTYNIMLALR